MTAERATQRRQANPHWRESGELLCNLLQPRCTGMLLAKLVAPENRMQMMHDDHADPNVDLEFCGAAGHVLPSLHTSEP